MSLACVDIKSAADRKWRTGDVMRDSGGRRDALGYKGTIEAITASMVM
jgi:hypothetical protein